MNEISVPPFADEIVLWQDAIQIIRGDMYDQLMLTFGDGSTLTLQARVKIPNIPDLLPDDEAEAEACHWAYQSTAARLLRKFMLSPSLTEMPQREPVVCHEGCGLLPANQLVCDLCEGQGVILKLESLNERLSIRPRLADHAE
jgi:hypothetical protein